MNIVFFTFFRVLFYTYGFLTKTEFLISIKIDFLYGFIGMTTKRKLWWVAVTRNIVNDITTLHQRQLVKFAVRQIKPISSIICGCMRGIGWMYLESASHIFVSCTPSTISWCIVCSVTTKTTGWTFSASSLHANFTRAVRAPPRPARRQKWSTAEHQPTNHFGSPGQIGLSWPLLLISVFSKFYSKKNSILIILGIFLSNYL